MKRLILLIVLVTGLVGCEQYYYRRGFFEALSRSEPENPHYYYMYGRSLLEDESYGAAIRKFRQALKMQPDFIEAKIGIAQAWYGRGWLRTALRHFQEAAEIGAPNPLILEGIGNCHYRMNDFESARKPFEQALAIDPTREMSLLRLGDIEYAQGNWEQAIEYWRRAESAGARKPHLAEIILDYQAYIRKYRLP